MLQNGLVDTWDGVPPKTTFDLRLYGGAKGNRTPDLLDANESSSMFVGQSCVGSSTNLLAIGLIMLVAVSCF